MTQGEFLLLKKATTDLRVLDVEGARYQSLVEIVTQFDDLDLCHLAVQRINFVSAIACATINDRHASNPAIAINVI